MPKFFYGQRVLFAGSIVTVIPHNREHELASADHAYVLDVMNYEMHIALKHLEPLPDGQL